MRRRRHGEGPRLAAEAARSFFAFAFSTEASARSFFALATEAARVFSAFATATAASARFFSAAAHAFCSPGVIAANNSNCFVSAATLSASSAAATAANAVSLDDTGVGRDGADPFCFVSVVSFAHFGCEDDPFASSTTVSRVVANTDSPPYYPQNPKPHNPKRVRKR